MALLLFGLATVAATAADGGEATTLAERFEQSRLVNRGAADLAAWLIMGLLVAGVAGMFSRLNLTFWGRTARVALGLAGALIGGMVARTVPVDFGWPHIELRLEELLLSLAGAILLVVVIRLVRARVRRAGGAFTSPPKTSGEAST